MPTPNNNSKKKETERSFPWKSLGLFVANPMLGVANYLINRYALPAKFAVADAVRRNVTVPIKKKVNSPISPITYTEEDLNDKVLDTLDSISIALLDLRVPDWRERTARGDTIRLGIPGKAYLGGDYASVRRGIKLRFTDPLGQLETTLGSYNLEATKDNLKVTDSYDFNTNVHLNGATRWGKIRNAFNFIGTPDTVPDNEKIHFVINSKRVK